MARRSLVFLFALAVGDYLVWNWSLNGNHDVIALVSGLTLPPLVLACTWMLAVGGARLVSRLAQRNERQAPAAPTRSRGYRTHAQRLPETAAADAGSTQGEPQPASRKIAA